MQYTPSVPVPQPEKARRPVDWALLAIVLIALVVVVALVISLLPAQQVVEPVVNVQNPARQISLYYDAIIAEREGAQILRDNPELIAAFHYREAIGAELVEFLHENPEVALSWNRMK